jgi:hypothetical protein
MRVIQAFTNLLPWPPLLHPWPRLATSCHAEVARCSVEITASIGIASARLVLVAEDAESGVNLSRSVGSRL